ncbi:transposase [Thalassotalea sp. G20_0]|nr:transposase [Thalassotalea sp. G20_0]
MTFSYLNSETGKKEKRTLPGEDFLWLVLKHVLPGRFPLNAFDPA